MRPPAVLLAPLVLVPGLSLAAPVEDALAARPGPLRGAAAGGAAPASRPHVDPEAGPGRHGGSLRLLMAKAKDTRQMVVYGYARLMSYTPELVLEPDILERVEVQGGRIFTLHLRPGHKWSDGHPFTAEDFRYWWEDVANNSELSPVGPRRRCSWTASLRSSRCWAKPPSAIAGRRRMPASCPRSPAHGRSISTARRII